MRPKPKPWTTMHARNTAHCVMPGQEQVALRSVFCQASDFDQVNRQPGKPKMIFTSSTRMPTVTPSMGNLERKTWTQSPHRATSPRSQYCSDLGSH